MASPVKRAAARQHYRWDNTSPARPRRAGGSLTAGPGPVPPYVAVLCRANGDLDTIERGVATQFIQIVRFRDGVAADPRVVVGNRGFDPGPTVPITVGQAHHTRHHVIRYLKLGL